MQLWTHLANTWGRRPALLLATCLTALLGMTNGFPRSFSVLLILRILVGMLNGQCGITKNYLSELCDESTEATAFAFVGLSWQIGWCAAAVAGGYFAHAERTFPSLAGWPLIAVHPYALPFLAVAVPPLVGVVLGMRHLPETLPYSRRGWRKPELPKIDRWTADMWRILKIWAMMILTNTAFQAVIPLFFFAPVTSGGLGAPTSSIGRRVSCQSLHGAEHIDLQDCGTHCGHLQLSLWSSQVCRASRLKAMLTESFSLSLC